MTKGAVEMKDNESILDKVMNDPKILLGLDKLDTQEIRLLANENDK